MDQETWLWGYICPCSLWPWAMSRFSSFLYSWNKGVETGFLNYLLSPCYNNECWEKAYFLSTSLRVRKTLSGSSVSFPQTLRLIGANGYTPMLFLRNEGNCREYGFLNYLKSFLLVWAAGSEKCKTNQNNPQSEPWHLAAFVTTSIPCAALICWG